MWKWFNCLRFDDDWVWWGYGDERLVDCFFKILEVDVWFGNCDFDVGVVYL